MPIDNMIASTGFAVLSSKLDSISNDLFYMFLTTEANLMRLQRIAESSTSSYPSISPGDILNLEIALPGNEKNIERLCNIFDAILKNIFQNRNEVKELAELRDWLLPMLMNGQVTVA